MTLDARYINTPAALHIYMQYALGLPAHYGRNLDALHDLLSETARPTHVALLPPAEPDARMAAYWPHVVRVFEDAAAENPRLTVELR